MILSLEIELQGMSLGVYQIVQARRLNLPLPDIRLLMSKKQRDSAYIHIIIWPIYNSSTKVVWTGRSFPSGFIKVWVGFVFQCPERLEAINLFVLGLTLVETHCPSVAFAVTLTLQAVPWKLCWTRITVCHILGLGEYTARLQNKCKHRHRCIHGS